MEGVRQTEKVGGRESTIKYGRFDEHKSTHLPSDLTSQRVAFKSNSSDSTFFEASPLDCGSWCELNISETSPLCEYLSTKFKSGISRNNAQNDFDLCIRPWALAWTGCKLIQIKILPKISPSPWQLLCLSFSP